MDETNPDTRNSERTNPDRTEGGSTTKGSTDDTVGGRPASGNAAAVPPNTDTDMAGSRPGRDPQDT